MSLPWVHGVGMKSREPIPVRCDPHVAFAVRKSGGVKICEILFTANHSRCNTLPSAMNKRSATKTYVSAWIPRALKRKLAKLAKTRGESITELVEYLLNKGTSNIELTAKDYEEIAQEVRAAEVAAADGTRVRVPRRGTQAEG